MYYSDQKRQNDVHPVLLRTTKYYSSTTSYYKVRPRTTPVLLRTTKYYSSTTKYYAVLQSTTPVLLRTTNVLLQYYSVLQSTTPVLQSTTLYYKVLLQYYFDRNDVRTTSIQYYSVLQTTPVLLRTTKYYSVLQSTTPCTTPYYKVLFCTTKYYFDRNDVRTTSIQYYSLLQSTTPVLQSTTPALLRTTKYYSSTTKYYSVLQSTPYYKVLLCTTKYYSDRNDVRTTSIQYCSVLQSTTPVLLRTTKCYSSTTPYYEVLLQYYKVTLCTTKYYSSTTSTETTSERRPSSTTPYYKVLLQYYKVLPRTTKYYSSTTPYYKVLLQYYSVLQTYYKVLLRTTEYYSSTTPYYKVVQKLPKRAFRARLPQLFKRQASKTSISCETSATFQATSFQNEHFVRDFRNFSRNKLPKRAFRTRLPQLFNQGASKVMRLPRKTRKWPLTLKVWSVKTSISCDTSFKFHTFNSKIDDFVRVFLIKPFLQSSKSMTFAKIPPLFKTITKSCACHDICSSVTFARHCHCDSWKQHLRHVTKCCACHDIAKGHITKCCACHEKTSRLHWHTAKVLRLSRKTRKWPHILWLGNAKTSISCETSSTFHTLKVRIVSQCECTAQWQRINELATTTRRRHDDDTTTTPKRAFRARLPPLFTLWR